MDTPTNPALDPGHSQSVTLSVTEEELRMAPKERLVHDHLDGIQHGIDDVAPREKFGHGMANKFGHAQHALRRFAAAMVGSGHDQLRHAAPVGPARS